MKGRVLIGISFFVLISLFSNIAVCAEEYSPKIDPKLFSPEINNPYFSLPANTTLMFRSHTGQDIERVEITIPTETKKVMGIDTRIYHDVVYLNDVLVEDTYDYLAQDDKGNVWYFGEDVNNYTDGKLSSHSGSWLAGVDGALPGIWFPANPKRGMSYRQEYLKGKAEDMSKIISVNETVEVPAGSFKNCIKTEDSSPLEPGKIEYKYYCREISKQVLELDGDERLELVDPKLSLKSSGEGTEYVNTNSKSGLWIVTSILIVIIAIFTIKAYIIK